MSWYVFPVLYTLFVWWFSTGLILYLDGLPQRTFRTSWLGATVILLAALYGLAMSSSDTSVGGAYCAFTCAVLVWGWQEMSFLMGFITGPRRTPCPADCSEWLRFVYALQTIIYHELALIVSAIAVVAVTWAGDNQVGTWTFMILWVMRQSAKLNLFLGVRNLSEEFLPEHLRYLESFFRKRPMNFLLPISVTASTVLATLLWRQAFAEGVGAFDAIGLTFLATMLTLAILEHWFLVLPLPATALWNWSLQSRTPREPIAADIGPPANRATVRIVNKMELVPPVAELATVKDLRVRTPKG